MSDLTATSPSLNQLPLEILHFIFHYIDVPDILRLRKVSRRLNEVSHSRHVWRDAYLTADCVRPPGPFLWQSKQDLESVLVSSCRVDRNLRRGGGTAQSSAATFKMREIRYTAVDLGVKLVFGRFLLVAVKSEVRCYDLNTNVSGRKTRNLGGSVIYWSPTGWTLKSFHCVSAIDVEGHPFACIVLNEASETTGRISIYLLHVEGQSEVTLDLLHQFERYNFINLVQIGPRVIVIHILGPNDGSLFAFDVCTRTMFTLSPSSDAVLMEVPNMSAIDDRLVFSIIPTSTHVVIATSFYTIATGWRMLFQAFVLPPPHHHHPTPSSINLSPSHHGLIPGTVKSCHTLLRDAVVDPTTQDVLIAIQTYSFERSCYLSNYSILRLSAAHASRDHKLGTITLQPLGPFGQSGMGMRLLHPSFHGTGRAFETRKPSHTAVSALEYDVRSRDDDREVDVAKVVEYPSILRFPTSRTLLDYDPYAGLICLRSATKPYNVLEILDLAV